MKASNDLNPAYGSFHDDAIRSYQVDNGVTFGFEDHGMNISSTTQTNCFNQNNHQHRWKLACTFIRYMQKVL